MVRAFFWDIYADIAFAAGMLLYAAMHQSDQAHLFAGALLGIVSIALWIKARIDLGKAYAVVPDARILVTRGLYTLVRHPMYVFSSTAVLGILIALNRPYFYVILPIFVGFQMLRSHKENLLLRERFGEARIAHEKRTWF